jgi:hypothetical protein
MSKYCAALLTFALVVCVHADEPKPNTLTAKEIADGWILLFDGETTFGWQIDGDSSVKDGRLTLGAEKETKAMSSTGFDHYRVRFDCSGRADHEIVVDNSKAGNSFSQKSRINMKVSPLSDIDSSFQFSVGSDGILTGEVTKTYKPTGALVSRFLVPAGGKFQLTDVKLQPLGLKSIFNGKDLTGWKEHPNRKSKFSVTHEGWLQIKDGPGDLQTEAQYDDFILQIECKTNGKLLNSGVFFRCRPGEYQQGYEAQIHNGFDADKPKEYVVEEYDPKTNELKDKKKIKAGAVDYGTGGIYRRIPARKQTAKDGEWFTMTVIAQGRHIATWVNGIQQVDWTDNRPLRDNARNGCRLEKGAISLQGHDPTTDLVFRNIRIVELPKLAEKK